MIAYKAKGWIGCQISERRTRLETRRRTQKSGRVLTTVRRFQLARRARHHLPIVFIVRSIRTALSLAKSRYENYVASDGLHPCRPLHTHNRYACVARNAILLLGRGPGRFLYKTLVSQWRSNSPDDTTTCRRLKRRFSAHTSYVVACLY